MKKIAPLFLFALITACSYIKNGPPEDKPLSAAEKEAISRATQSPQKGMHSKI